MSNAKPDFPTPNMRPTGTPHLSKAIGKITRRAMTKRGFKDLGIFTHWESIVGAPLAQYSIPIRLTRRNGGTLIMRVEGAMALEVQHLSPLIIDRINGYYGQKIVQQIAIRQGPVFQSAPKVNPQNPKHPETIPPQPILDAFEDSPLKSALARLGAHIHQKP